MDHKQLRPVKHRKGIICIELAVVENFGERVLEATISIPDHEGISERTWPMQYGGLNSRNWEDCLAYVGTMLWSSIQAHWPPQEVLPL